MVRAHHAGMARGPRDGEPNGAASVSERSAPWRGRSRSLTVAAPWTPAGRPARAGSDCVPTRPGRETASMNRVRVAVVQAAPVAFDREGTLERVRALTAEAAGEGARLIVFPEAFVSGYPRGLDFGARVGSRTPEGRELFRRYWESAVDVPGSATDELGAAARDAGAYLVIGVIERDGGTLYCTVLFFDPSGSLMGRHRKLMPTASERLIWGQ